MTPTAKELMASPIFWSERITQQTEYIENYRGTRDDWREVLSSAIYIRDRCRAEYQKLVMKK